ncbi:MAG: UDP-N-acetylmuramoyl-L-alanyl-D-glutamate--2,6-diaminopimelate ligase [Planctomycetales bacterium]
MIGSGSLKIGALSMADLLPKATFHGASDIWFTSCCSDASSCRRGDVFVAVIDVDGDGHESISRAVKRGVTGIITERLVPNCEVPVCIVPDTRIALGEISHALAGFPSRRINVVGVTGTHGKTTTTCLIKSVFKAAGLESGIMNTMGYCDGQRTSPAAITTPPAPILANYLARMRDNGCTHGIVEMSSESLAQHQTSGIELDVACVTNVHSGHLDYHGNAQNYREAKWRMLEQLRTQGLAVLNADDDVCCEFLDQFAGPALTIAMQRPAELTGTVMERLPSEQTFLLQCGSDSIPVRTHIIGDHHVYNCLTAAAVGLAYRIDLPTIVRGLEVVDQLPGRLQRIECGQPFNVFVDDARTPEALEISLRTLREITQGRLICVFGAKGERDRQQRPLMGQAIAKMADLTVLTEDSPRHEDSAAIVEQVLQGMRDAPEVIVELDRACAIDTALSVAEAGDCVLITGRGHQTHQLIGRQQVYFDDREVASMLLRGPGFDVDIRRAA